jgi:hypothetical protein
MGAGELLEKFPLATLGGACSSLPVSNEYRRRLADILGVPRL